MSNQRLRPLFAAAGLLALIWLVCWAGFAISRGSKMTPEKIRQYVRSVDFGKLSSAERMKALLALAAKLNAIPREERMQAHLSEDWRPWFAQMTESEKETFIAATLPADVKQMIDSFEKLTPERRKRTIDEAMKNLKKEQAPTAQDKTGDNGDNSSTNAPVTLSPEMVQKAETLGLRTFYSESSPETKAELAPLLEEVQRQMESGRSFHGEN